MLTPLETRLREHGIVHPIYTVEMAAREKFDLAYACAMLTMETSGGWNEFGHDPGNPVQGGWVNEERYRLMRHYVSQGYPSQGVGPCQLTSTGLQDEADQIGGCWLAEHNMAVGFHFLQELIHEHGEVGGFTAYNGSGPAADAYGQHAAVLAAEFRKVIQR